MSENKPVPDDPHEPLTLTAEDIPAQGALNDPLDLNYSAVRIPDDKKYPDMNYAERRAILLQRIEQAGHPRALGQTYAEMADEFGVSKATIHRDLKTLAEWTAENVERDHVHIMDSVFRGAVLDLVDDGKKAWAAEVGKEWFEWLADMGAIERVPDKVDLDATVEQADETEDYEVVESTSPDPSNITVECPDCSAMGTPGSDCSSCGTTRPNVGGVGGE